MHTTRIARPGPICVKSEISPFLSRIAARATDIESAKAPSPWRRSATENVTFEVTPSTASTAATPFFATASTLALNASAFASRSARARIASFASSNVGVCFALVSAFSMSQTARSELTTAYLRSSLLESSSATASANPSAPGHICEARFMKPSWKPPSFENQSLVSTFLPSSFAISSSLDEPSAAFTA